MSDLYTKSASVAATPDLVGRASYLQAIDQAVRGKGPVVVLQIIGEGGMGKTRLLKAALQRYQDDSTVLAAHQVVDLYHTATHSSEGLMAAICDALDPQKKAFTGYRKARAELDAYLAEPLGGRNRLKLLNKDLQDMFCADLQALASTRRVLLALDTVETLVYELTEVEHRLGLMDERLQVWNWLRDEMLPCLSNAVVLLAGRPQIEQLTTDLADREVYHFVRLSPLGGFDQSEALAYFAAVTDHAEQEGNCDVAERIRSIPEEWRNQLITNTDGRPILLALVIDYLVVEAQLPSDLLTLQDEALEETLVTALLQSDRPMMEAVETLAWARKGMDADLLARVAERRTEAGDWDLDWAQAALQELHKLSFVKVRPADQRLFLHDEMYDLLEKYVLQPETNPQAAERAYTAILKYYQEQINLYREEIAKLYGHLNKVKENKSESAKEIIYQITDYQQRLDSALTEDLHYQLRRNASRGFNIYYRYAEEAVLGENRSLDIELRAELLSFLAAKDPTGKQATVAGLDRAKINADGAIRWVKRRFMYYQNAAAVQLVKTIRDEYPVLQKDTLAYAELSVWEALATNFISLKAQDEVINRLQEAIRSIKDEAYSWRQIAILGRAYNSLGYTQRTKGAWYAAIAAYKKAILYSRSTKMNLEQASTLNNLAFARAEIGELDTANRQANDALIMRQGSGSRAQVAWSFNTFGQIALRESQFDRARAYAQKALTFFEQVNDQRGRGLALLTLAEAKRRYGQDRYNEATEKMLQEAIEHAQEAQKLLTEEPIRWLEATIELGCNYRSQVYYLRKIDVNFDVTEAADKSRQALSSASSKAKEIGTLYLEMDALINQAWLEYYLEVYYRWMSSDALEPQSKRARTAAGEACTVLLNKAEKLFPANYYIVESSGKPQFDDDQKINGEDIIVPLFSRYGKLQLLRGQRAFNEFEHQRDNEKQPLKETKEHLHQAIEHYTLSLAYDNLIDKRPFRDKQRAKERIYERIKSLNPQELKEVFLALESAEQKYILGKSDMRNFLEEDFGSLETVLVIDQDF